MAFGDWVGTVEGEYINEDAAYGSQCVDVAINYVKWLYPSQDWRNVLGAGNAVDLWGSASANYFEKIPLNSGPLPEPGDIAIWGATPSNEFGHIAVVIDRNSQGMLLMEQDGFIDVDHDGNADGKTYRKFRYYGANLIGWLRPKGVNDMYVITKEAEDAESIAATGSKPGKGYDYRWVGKTDVDGFISFWATYSQVPALQGQVNELARLLSVEQNKPPKEIIKEVEKIVEVPTPPTDNQAADVVATKSKPLFDFLTKVFNKLTGKG